MKKEDTAIVNIDSCRNKAIEAWNRRANDGKTD
nr:MAG TPA: restriction alleviation protein [Caudoviricetes sp.]